MMFAMRLPAVSAQAPVPCPGFRHISALPVRQLLRVPPRSSSSPDYSAKLDNAKAKVSEVAGKAGEVAKNVASRLSEEASKRDIKVPDLTKLDVDIKSLVTWNFIGQFFLTAVSWGVVFFTSHLSIAKGADLNPTTGILLLGVVLSGYSAYKAYSYLTQIKAGGLSVLEGWGQLKAFFDHMNVNFIGALCAIVALQAEVGTLMMTSMTSSTAAALKIKATEKAGSLATEALAQAAANTLLAHLVSIAFLALMTRKVTDAYQKILEWSDNLKKSIPSLS